MRYVLALDSGGTKCDALLTQDDGTVLGFGHVDARDPNSGTGFVGSGRSLKSVSRAVMQAMGDRYCEELVIVTFNKTIPQMSFFHSNVDCIRLRSVDELMPAFAMVGETAGITVLAGTGALVAGQTADGRYNRLDGLGPILGDYGGGHHIGLLATRAAAKSYWHARHHTTLLKVVMNAMGFAQDVRGVGAIVDYMLGHHDRSEIAKLARLVNEEANAGDRVAREILQEAAAAIAETVWDVTDNLGIANESLPLIGIGSVVTKSDIYWQHLCECVRQFAPNFRFMRVESPPVIGMALIVLGQLTEIPSDVLKARLLETYERLEARS